MRQSLGDDPPYSLIKPGEYNLTQKSIHLDYSWVRSWKLKAKLQFAFRNLSSAINEPLNIHIKVSPENTTCTSKGTQNYRYYRTESYTFHGTITSAGSRYGSL